MTTAAQPTPISTTTRELAGYLGCMTTSPSEPVDDPHPEEAPEHDGEKPRSKDDESAPEYVDDSQLPEDLRPTDDNPLAQNEDE